MFGDMFEAMAVFMSMMRGGGDEDESASRAIE